MQADTHMHIHSCPRSPLMCTAVLLCDNENRKSKKEDNWEKQCKPVNKEITEESQDTEQYYVHYFKDV